MAADLHAQAYVQVVKCALCLLFVSFYSEKGDILMLDNMLSAHGRSPYTGQRKIVVAMGDMIHSNNIAKPTMEEVYAN